MGGENQISNFTLPPIICGVQISFDGNGVDIDNISGYVDFTFECLNTAVGIFATELSRNGLKVTGFVVNTSGFIVGILTSPDDLADGELPMVEKLKLRASAIVDWKNDNWDSLAPEIKEHSDINTFLDGLM